MNRPRNSGEDPKWEAAFHAGETVPVSTVRKGSRVLSSMGDTYDVTRPYESSLVHVVGVAGKYVGQATFFAGCAHVLVLPRAPATSEEV